jgi:hypothetical protein
LHVEPLGRVVIEAPDHQPARRHDLAVILGPAVGSAEEDVDATSGHLGGDGDRAHSAGLGDDGRFGGIVLGAQGAVKYAAFAQDRAEPVARSYRSRAYENWLSIGAAPLDVVCDPLVFGRCVCVAGVRVIDTDDRLVGRDADARHPVDR